MSQWRATACILCENNCGLFVHTPGRRVVKMRGDKAHPGSRGYTCNKAPRLDHYQNGGQRLTTPLRRNADGSHTELSWGQAIGEIAQRLGAIKAWYGG